MARAVLSISLSIAAGSSFASYDLMFIQAFNTDPGTVFSRVHRVDPSNGLQLGSFNIGPQSFGLAASRARGELYTADINGNLRTWNYSTGDLKRIQYMGNTTLRDITISPNGTDIISLHGTNEIRTFNVLTGVSFSNTIAGTTLNRLTVNPNGIVFAYDSGANQMRRLTRSGSTYSLQSSESAYGSFTSANVGQLSFTSGLNNDNLYMGSRADFYSVNLLNLGSNTFVGFGGLNNTLNNHGTVNGYVPSHAGSYAFGNDSNVPSNVRVSHIDAASYYTSSFTYSGINGGARNATIVLAPEPGSLSALAAGLFILARRKKGANTK